MLIEHGLVPDFIAQLEGAMAALRASIDGRGAAVGARVSATKQVQVSTELAVQYMKLMHAQLGKVLKSDAPKLREWKNLQHVVAKGVIPAAVASTALATPVVAGPALLSSSANTAEAKAA